MADSWTSRTRHARVWLAQERIASTLPDIDRARVVAWMRAARPFVATRGAAVDDGAVHLGLATPPPDDRRRIAFAVDADAVARVEPPIALVEAIDAAPSAWRPALYELVETGKAIATTWRVYGSLAWQAASGLVHVRPDSDIDLVWPVRDEAQGRACIAALLAWERRHAIRLDGEARLDGTSFVAWRELASDGDRVLVKTAHGVELRPHPWTPMAMVRRMPER